MSSLSSRHQQPIPAGRAAPAPGAGPIRTGWPPLLSGLVADGLDHAELRFGGAGRPVRAAALQARGAALFGDGPSSDTVGALLTNDRASVELLLGALDAGARLVSLPPPGRGVDLARYLSFVDAACTTTGVGQLVVRDDLAGHLADLKAKVCPHGDLGREPLAAGRAGGFELMQFSSGTTGPPRAVGLSDEALGANVAAIIERIGPAPGDGVVSWLPLSHDMGLVGMLLTSIASAGPGRVGRGRVSLLDPTDFLRDPSSWLRMLSEEQATITAAPDFGYRLCVRRGRVPDRLDRLRCAIVGGEVVRPSTLKAFADKFGPAGLDARVLSPAYGMAEVGLAVTLTEPGAPWRELAVSAGQLADGLLRPPDPSGAVSLAASGTPLDGFEIRVDAHAGELGRISVRGPSVGDDVLAGRSYAGEDGWLATSDLGAVVDGWLYVTGRADDYLVVHGRQVHAPTLEDRVAGEVAGARPGRVAAVGLPTGEWIVVAEPADPQQTTARERAALARRIHRAVVTATGARPLEVRVVDRGRLPLTSSGKLQRFEIIRRFLSGDL